MDNNKKHYKFSIFMIAVALLVAAGVITLLIYLAQKGELDDFSDAIASIMQSGSIYALLVIFLAIIIPVLLILIIIVSVVRRNRFKKVSKTWEDALKLAAAYEAEKEAKAKAAKIPSDHRFGTLNALDNAKPNNKSTSAERVALADFCENLRAFAAEKFNLYYDISVIRQFVSGLAVSHLMILQGMSGTGKTSLAYVLGEFIGNPSVIVPVQPVWKERTDLLGYYNEFTKKYSETVLLQKMYEADGNGKFYVVVLDELNIARVEYYFAEFLSLLEIPDRESRYLSVVPDKWQNDPERLKDGRIRLPDNMWFIGTVNNDDSTFAISDKVYDRAMVINLNSKATPFAVDGDNVKKTPVSAAGFAKMVASAQAGYEITARNMHRLKMLDEYLIEKFQITFGNRIMKQIKDYVSVYVGCGGGEMEAIDDIIVKKVLRKLEMQNAVYVKNQAEELCAFMSDLFGENRVPECLKYIRRVARNA